MEKNLKYMSFDQHALIRSIGVVPGKYMVLLGAGASASSGIPTANQCIWEWKREIFLSANPTLSPSLFSDISLPATQEKIQKWLDTQGCYPALGHDSEYAYYIERCYPRSEDRTAYFNNRLSNVIPQMGYKLLAMLQNRNILQWIWTTNFDGLVRQSRSPDHTTPLKEIGLDSAARICEVRDGENHGYLIALHGDYRYDRIKNTSGETQTLQTELCTALMSRLRSQPIIVLGYGGRDESIMSTLEGAYRGTCSGGGIYWCVKGNETVSPRISGLIEMARKNGFSGNLIEIDGFDDFMLRLGRYIFRTGQDAVEVQNLSTAAAPLRSEFRLTGYAMDDDWIKGNALSIELPQGIYQFEASGIKGWRDLRAAIGTESISAGLLKGKVLAVGDATKISAVFAGRLTSQLALSPLQPAETAKTVVGGILLDALQLSISVATGLERTGKRKRILWDKSRFRHTLYSGVRHLAYEAVKISLSFATGKQFVNLVPDIHVVQANGEEATLEAVKDIKRQLLGGQWNKAYNEAVEEWCDRILGHDSSRVFQFPGAPFDPFTFKVSRPLPYARMLLRSQVSRACSPKRPGECFEATILPEHPLVFGTEKSPIPGQDVHPLRGVVHYGPYDLELTRTGYYREVKLGVICPQGCEQALSSYLAKLLLGHSAVESKSEYLLPFPGFQQTYRIPLRIPDRGAKEWRTLPLKYSNVNLRAAQTEVCSGITRAVDNLISLGTTDVAIILIPKAWKSFEVVEDDGVHVDLHDYIKAYCAQRNVRTQFLREDTLFKQYQCEILWWLAQALYVKSVRTPFVLQTNDNDTVFVGIGYGMTKGKEKGVVLGCSHIYDAAGQGLRYHVSRIQDPIWIQDNPFLKKDDAISIGYQVRQLFHQTYQKLPHRVVIHKRTPFVGSEQEGLTQSLKGVAEVEMITVEEEPSWRFLSYDKIKQSVDGFPVKRNTVLVYGNDQALLWVHGAVKNIKDYKTYFQGKSRIPSPLRITRFAGQAPIETVAREILGLSKMDWNSCDLYGQFPATLESSSAIAKVGQLMSRFGSETYDYRLFI